jgi:hypothetical protein
MPCNLLPAAILTTIAESTSPLVSFSQASLSPLFRPPSRKEASLLSLSLSSIYLIKTDSSLSAIAPLLSLAQAESRNHIAIMIR